MVSSRSFEESSESAVDKRGDPGRGDTKINPLDEGVVQVKSIQNFENETVSKSVKGIGKI